jgi:hypothetical protein
LSAFRYRLVDTAGSELGIIALAVGEVAEGDTVQTPDGSSAEVVEVYDDEFGREGGVVATLVVDDGAEEGIPEDAAQAVLGLVDQLGLGSQRDAIAGLAAELRDQPDGPQQPK